MNKGQTDKPCCPLTSQNWGALLHTAKPPAALNPLPDSYWEPEGPGLRQTLLAVNDGGWGTQGNRSAVLLEFLGPKHARGAPNWSQGRTGCEGNCGSGAWLLPQESGWVLPTDRFGLLVHAGVSGQVGELRTGPDQSEQEQGSGHSAGLQGRE